MVGIRYIGNKNLKVDNVAGTGLVWAPDEVHNVSPGAARLLLRHPDVWAQVDGEPLEAAPPEPRGLSNPVPAAPTLVPSIRLVADHEMVNESQTQAPPVQTEETDVSSMPSLPPNINNMTAAHMAALLERDFGERVELTDKDGQKVPASVIRQRLVAAYNSGRSPRAA